MRYHSYMDTKGMHTKAGANADIYKRIILPLRAPRDYGCVA